jgi:hypothetical protein
MEAEEVARTLVLRDFLEAYNAVAEQRRRAGASLVIVQDPTSQAQELVDALRRVSDTSIPEIERGEVQLNKLLDDYRDMQAVAEGQIKRLLINVPPGDAKSLIVSVLWPTWMWIRTPEGA